MEREVNPAEKATYQERLNRIHDRFSRFPETDIDVDDAGEMTAAKFSYTFPDYSGKPANSDKESTPGFIDSIAGVRSKDGSLTIFYNSGSLGGRVKIKKNESGEIEILKSMVYHRFPKSETERGNVMTPAFRQNEKPYRPDLRAIDMLLAKTEAKMIDDPEFFRNRLTKSQEEKVMKWNRAMANGKAVGSARLKRRRAEEQKREDQKSLREVKIAVVKRKKL